MKWVIDPMHSTIEFSAKHLMLTTVRGSFKAFNLDLEFEPARIENTRIKAIVQADSLDSGQEPRDAHLKSAHFLDVENYPTLSFQSTAVERVGEGEYLLKGELTIKEITQPVTFRVQDEGRTVDQFGNEHRGFSAETTINRKDWGLNWNVALESGGWLVGEKIKLELQISLMTEEAFRTMLASFQRRTAESVPA
jgi:polyisoprenoid-binding protein YceI